MSIKEVNCAPVPAHLRQPPLSIALFQCHICQVGETGSHSLTAACRWGRKPSKIKTGVGCVCCLRLFLCCCLLLSLLPACCWARNPFRNEPAELHQKQPNEQPHLSQSVTFDFVDRYVQNNLFEGYFPSLFQKITVVDPQKNIRKRKCHLEMHPQVSFLHMKCSWKKPLRNFSVSSAEGQGIQGMTL